MSSSPIANKTTAPSAQPKYAEHLESLKKERGDILASLKALNLQPAQQSGEFVLNDMSKKKLQSRLKAVDTEIGHFQDYLNVGANAAPTKADAVSKPVDQVAAGAAPRAERSEKSHKPILQAPPRAINNLGAQLTAKGVKLSAPPPLFKAED